MNDENVKLLPAAIVSAAKVLEYLMDRASEVEDSYSPIADSDTSVGIVWRELPKVIEYYEWASKQASYPH